MKRSFIAAAVMALLLTGCDTGKNDPADNGSGAVTESVTPVQTTAAAPSEAVSRTAVSSTAAGTTVTSSAAKEEVTEITSVTLPESTSAVYQVTEESVSAPENGANAENSSDGSPEGELLDPFE